MPGIDWLDKLLREGMAAVLRVYSGGTQVPERGAIEFKGAGVAVADNPGTGRTDITVAGPAGFGATNPPPSVAAASARGVVVGRFALEDHAHGHGTQTDGTMHAAASTSANGFLSSATYSEIRGEPATIASGRAPVGFVRTGSKWVSPNSATPVADIVAAQASGYHTQLNDDAVYTLEAALSAKSNLEIYAARGGAILVPHASFAPSGALADSDTSYVISAAATIGADVGFLPVTAYRESRFCRFSFAPTTGNYYLLRTGDASVATVTGHLDQQVQAGAYLYELVRVVASSAAGGGEYNVTLERALDQSHYGHATTRPTRVFAVTAPFDTLALRNIRFSFAGKPHAVGALASACKRVELENVDITGFSRAGIHVLYGTAEIDAYQRGGTNCAIRLTGTSGRVRLRSREPGVNGRCHASGVPRGAITLRGNASNVEIYDSEIVGLNTGIDIFGGIGNTIRDTRIIDMDPSDRVTRDADVAVVAAGAIKTVAAGWSVNCFSTGVADTLWAYDTHVDNVHVIGCGRKTGSGDPEQPGAYVCDVKSFRAGLITFRAQGPDRVADTAAPNYGRVMMGLMTNDAFDVRIGRMECNAIDIAWADVGNGATCLEIGDMVLSNTNAHTSVSWWGLSLNAPAVTAHIGRLSIFDIKTGGFGYSYFAAAGTAAFEGLSIGEIVDASTDDVWQNVSFAKTTMACAIGERVEVYDNASVRSARNPSTSYGDDKAIVVLPYARGGTSVTSGDWALVARGPLLSIATTQTPARGAHLVAGTTRDVIEHVAGADYAPVGIVERTKSGGLVRVTTGNAPTVSKAKTPNTVPMRGTSGECSFGPLTAEKVSAESGGTAFFEIDHSSFIVSALATSTNWAYYGTASGTKSCWGIDALNTCVPGITLNQAGGDASAGVIVIDAPQIEHTGQITCRPTVLARTGTVTPDMSTGNIFSVGDVDSAEELTGNVTIAAPTHPGAGSTLEITFRGNGTNTLSWNAVYQFGSAGNAQPTATPTNDTIYVVAFRRLNGTNWRCVSSVSVGG